MFPMMILFMLVVAALTWLLIARSFKYIGKGVEKIIEPLRGVDEEKYDE